MHDHLFNCGTYHHIIIIIISTDQRSRNYASNITQQQIKQNTIIWQKKQGNV